MCGPKLRAKFPNLYDESGKHLSQPQPPDSELAEKIQTEWKQMQKKAKQPKKLDFSPVAYEAKIIALPDEDKAAIETIRETHS